MLIRITAAAAAVLLAGAVHAQSYPTKTIQMIVPVQAGSGADSILRIVANKMADNMKQQIVIENLAGAAGLIGAEKASRAPNDGYTLFGANDGTLTMTPHLYRKVNFDPLAFDPVSLLAAINWTLIAHPSLPARNVKEFIALAKSRPDQIDYSSGGVGSPQHIAMEVFMSRTGIKLHHVPYRGATQAAIDVVSGQVQCMFTATSIVLGNIKEGKVRALGVGSAKRSPQLPDVPTIAEAGVPGFEYYTWAGLFMPKGAPKAAVDKLNAEAVKALADPTVRNTLLGLALDPVGSTPEELGRLTREGYDRMGKVIRAAGVQQE
jgi:tripartite-type tricarboxylate transporter receptor subunit TctC